MRTIKYTDHVLERMSIRQINKRMVQECVKRGARQFIDNSYHYKYGDLTVVLGKNDVTIITTYKGEDNQ